MESQPKCLFCDSVSIKYEGLCEMCKYYRYELPRSNKRIKELVNYNNNYKFNIKNASSCVCKKKV